MKYVILKEKRELGRNIMSIFDKKVPSPKKEKMSLGERLRKSPAAHAYKEAKVRIRYAPSAIKGAAQYSATQEQKKQLPKKQLKKLVGSVGHLASQDKPFSRIAKSAGLKGRGGGSGRAYGSSGIRTPKSKPRGYWGDEPFDF